MGPQNDHGSAEARKGHPVLQSSHLDIIGGIEHVLKALRDKELKAVTTNSGETNQHGPESDPLDDPNKNLDVSEFAGHEDLTEVVNADEPRADSQLFEVAKAIEINGLQNPKTWRAIPQKELPETTNVLSRRFVLTIVV